MSNFKIIKPSVIAFLSMQFIYYIRENSHNFLVAPSAPKNVEKYKLLSQKTIPLEVWPPLKISLVKMQNMNKKETTSFIYI